jgi:putative transposase
VLAVVPKGNQEMVAAAIRTIFAQPDAEHAHDQLEVIATMLGKQLPKVEAMLHDAKDDLLPSPGSRYRTGRRLGRPIHSSGSTRKSQC